MDEETKAIEKNQAWDLVDLLVDKTPIGVKWVYKMKVNEKGLIEKYKEILFANGFVQQPSIDYGETFSPIARLDIVRIILVVLVENKWPCYQMDIKLAFLNVILEEVYVNSL